MLSATTTRALLLAFVLQAVNTAPTPTPSSDFVLTSEEEATGFYFSPDGYKIYPQTFVSGPTV